MAAYYLLVLMNKQDCSGEQNISMLSDSYLVLHMGQSWSLSSHFIFLQTLIVKIICMK